MKKPLRSIFLLLLFICGTQAYAQQDPIHIGILPFDVTDANANNIKDIVQDQVTVCFAGKGRFFLLDRSVTEKLKAELERVKEASSAYAKIVADQGHMAGAQYLITGKVSSMEMGTTNTTNYLGKAVVNYHGTLHLTLQINTVETGKIYAQETITAISRDFDSNNPSDIFNNALCKLKSEVQKKVRTWFSTSITIVGVDKAKNGIPQKVLINAGKEIFDDGKNANCDASALAGLFASRKVYLDVISVEEIKFGATVSKREKKIGELKIDEVQGDITVCSVTKGDKDIKQYMDDKKPLIVKTQ